MMVLPLVIIMILPKVMNDPETRKVRFMHLKYFLLFKKFLVLCVICNFYYSFVCHGQEMEHLNSLTRYDMPEMSEVLTSFFTGGDTKKVKAARKKKAQ